MHDLKAERMTTEPLPLPAAGCGKCGRAAEPGTKAGQRCANLTPEGPCDGSFRATQSPADWLLC
ncbi:MAG: hypothetical protein EBT83_05625, partial [Betaproteobacteria bacterium]|nr:hypothetical protein [Betaproteobacteria bacterium]